MGLICSSFEIQLSNCILALVFLTTPLPLECTELIKPEHVWFLSS